MPKSLMLLLLGFGSLLLWQDITEAKRLPVKASNTVATKAKIPNVTGTTKDLPFGDMPLTGTISNDGKLSFAGKVRGMKLGFAGTLTGQTMKGTADLPIGRKNWAANKQADASDRYRSNQANLTLSSIQLYD
jgi:hypothetical protein